MKSWWRAFRTRPAPVRTQDRGFALPAKAKEALAPSTHTWGRSWPWAGPGGPSALPVSR